jgi:hypothetical protein
MLLTRHFVYVHIPRTGGNFVRNVILPHAPASWQHRLLGDHDTVAAIPATHAHLPRLAFVRNPHSWYVSWYSYQQRIRDPYFLEVSENGTLPFDATMRRALTSTASLAQGEGPFTQTIKEMLGPGLMQVRAGKTEHLREDLLRLLTGITALPEAMTEAIRALPPQNTSERGHYSSYYDAGLRQLVWEKDREVFDYFGYQWEDAPG